MSNAESTQPERYKTFKDFYPFYLSQHVNTVCRRMHFVGSSLILGIILAVLTTGQYVWLWAVPLAGYGFAWIGHFVFEKNRPATFTYPIYSLMGDWVMYFHILTGKIKF
jgi:hypothetical protein